MPPTHPRPSAAPTSGPTPYAPAESTDPYPANAVDVRADPAPADPGAPGAPGSVGAEPDSGLIGRDHELRVLEGALRDPGTRMVTLVGPAGVGKSVLAAAVASTLTPG
ncbi:AAA family ATPase, partial [Streptomyces sp. NPDC059072]